MVVGARPVYAPALVAFVGGAGFGVSVGVGGGGVAAWFPLGPGEVYRPAYHVSEVYVRQINIVHVTNVSVIGVTNVRYVNQNVQGAVMVVPHEAFVTARPVAQVSVRVDARVIAQAQVTGTTALVAPRRESIVVVRTGGPVAAPPARLVQRTVVVKTAPPPPPVSFAARQQALQANPGRPLEPAQVNTLRNNAPAPRPMVRTLPTRQEPAVAQPQPRSDRPPNATPRPQPAAQPAAQPAVRQEPPNERMPVARPPQPAAQPAAAPRNERPQQEAAPKEKQKKKEEKK